MILQVLVHDELAPGTFVRAQLGPPTNYFCKALEERTYNGNKFHQFLPTFGWSAKTYILPKQNVKEVTPKDLHRYIRQQLGTAYLIRPNKEHDILVLLGVIVPPEGTAIQYRTRRLMLETFTWETAVYAVSSKTMFVKRPFTVEEESWIAVANLQFDDAADE